MNLSDVVKIPATGLGENKFVGIRISDNQIEFHYPETFELPNDDKSLRKDIISILRSIELAKTLTRDKSTFNTKRANEYSFPLHAFLWIINDYLTYGTYINREKIFEEGVKGKINWKRTLHGNPAASQGNVIYTKIISERKNQADNFLTEIYFYCVQKSIDAIGWIYGLVFDSKGIDYYRLFNEKKYVAAINTELFKTFDDTKKIRLSNMRDVILGLDNESFRTKQLIYGVDSYEYVFEKMIDMMFSRVNRKEDFYPNAFWDLIYPMIQTSKSTNLRPDTISIKKKKVFILDAKYYRYGTTLNPADLPETTSIQKQITYGEYIKKVKDGDYDDVFSAFVMPYNKLRNPIPDTLIGDIEFIGIARAKWIDDDENNRRIAGILIDTRFLVENWMRRCDHAFDELTGLIEKKVGDPACQ